MYLTPSTDDLSEMKNRTTIELTKRSSTNKSLTYKLDFMDQL